LFFNGMRTRATLKGFTLIELVIVVAIIAVLAAIAVPNLIAAQTRAKVSRVKADLRSAATCMETYAVDNNAYPEPLLTLSTPIAYATDAYAPDVFASRGGWFALGYVQGRHGSDPAFLQQFGVVGATPAERSELAKQNYFVFSNGPDHVDDALKYPNEAFRDVIRAPGAELGYFYDPTNGTLSRGDIVRSSLIQP
jgi:prepilin-type N-terminal cleavage/methylation domain-containing protein